MILIILFWLLFFVVIYLLFNSSKEEKKDIFLRKERPEHKREYFEKHYDYNFSKEDRKIIFEKFNNSCFKCGSKKNLTIDHHMPLNFGYRLEEKNAVLLCKKCNNKKSNRLPQSFYTEKELKVLRDKYSVETDYDFESINKSNIEKRYEEVRMLYKGKVPVEFDYLGKRVEGFLEGIVIHKEGEFNKKNLKYMEVEEDGEINLYMIKNVKKLYIKGEEKNAHL